MPHANYPWCKTCGHPSTHVQHTEDGSADVNTEVTHPFDPVSDNVFAIYQELDTWSGMTAYMDYVHDYASEATHGGDFPHGWEDFHRDLSLWIGISNEGEDDDEEPFDPHTPPEVVT